MAIPYGGFPPSMAKTNRGESSYQEGEDGHHHAKPMEKAERSCFQQVPSPSPCGANGH